MPDDVIENSADDDLRSQLISAMEQSRNAGNEPAPSAQTPAPSQTPASTQQQPASTQGNQHQVPRTPPVDRGDGRAPDGRFVAKQGSAAPAAEGKPPAGAAPTVPGQAPTSKDAPAGQNTTAQTQNNQSAPTVPSAFAPPIGWKPEEKAQWHTLPQWAREAISSREAGIQKLVSQRDGDAGLGKEIRSVIAPYMAQIQAEGGTPQSVVSELLKTSYILRSGSQQAKIAAMQGIARQFGIDLRTVVGAPASQPAPAGSGNAQTVMVNGQPMQIPQSNDPAVNALIQHFQALQQRISEADHAAQEEQQRQQLEIQRTVEQDIAAFRDAADEQGNLKHPYFEQVKGHMAALFRSGATSSMADAYDQACWARPEIRQALQAQERAAAEAARRAEEQQRVGSALRKSVSIVGAPGIAVPNAAPAQNRSLREEIEANMAAAARSTSV